MSGERPHRPGFGAAYRRPLSVVELREHGRELLQRQVGAGGRSVLDAVGIQVFQYYKVSATAICVPPPPPPAPAPPPHEKIVLRGVHFDFDKAKIRPEDMPVLDEAAETLRANPNMRVEGNGYTDAIGSEAYNLRLSKRRARRWWHTWRARVLLQIV